MKFIIFLSFLVFFKHIPFCQVFKSEIIDSIDFSSQPTLINEYINKDILSELASKYTAVTGDESPDSKMLIYLSKTEPVRPICMVGLFLVNGEEIHKMKSRMEDEEYVSGLKVLIVGNGNKLYYSMKKEEMPGSGETSCEAFVIINKVLINLVLIGEEVTLDQLKEFSKLIKIEH